MARRCGRGDAAWVIRLWQKRAIGRFGEEVAALAAREIAQR